MLGLPYSPDPAIDFTKFSKANLPSLLCAMPKAELHVHIEGSLEPELMFALAQKHGLKLPYANVEQLRQAYAFSDLQSFLNIYYAGASVLLDEDDFFQMTWAYLQKAAAENIVHTEIFFDPQTHTERGVSIATVLNGLQLAKRKAQLELGISVEFILCFLRHLSQEAAQQTLTHALPYRYLADGTLSFIGVGLDSSERGHPPEKFAQVFERALDLGLRVVAHAGEEGPPEYIWNALKQLQVERIDHGVRSIEDASLIAHLARHRVPLTVCPLSNVKLRVYPQMKDHNLGALLKLGLCVLLNSDDPAYFGGYLNENFLQTFVALNLGVRDAWQLAANSFEASFLTETKRREFIFRLDRYFLQVRVEPISSS